MKNNKNKQMKRILYIVTIIFFVVSCSQDTTDEKNSNSFSSAELIGKWKLMKVEHPFAIRNTDYQNQKITFTFQSKTVIVSEDNQAFYKGTYPYRISAEKITVTESNPRKMVVIDDTKFTYKYEKGILELSNAYADGVIIYLVRY